ncbi:unnamed protein product [Protopolystoma xenopodis]|uniref:LIM zinc-binding domain-containing protein n=1 Tax=Protopolystoma xenopodis TaxID=117903 RepID=A0A448XA01_9PLAT|nr:unnamed protein product [Protopolystoma xenopodis]
MTRLRQHLCDVTADEDEEEVELELEADIGQAQSLMSLSACPLCVGCGRAIFDAVILHVQPDLEWHGRCLRCVKCSRGLGEDSTCFVRDGKAYCREDYHK